MTNEAVKKIEFSIESYKDEIKLLKRAVKCLEKTLRKQKKGKL